MNSQMHRDVEGQPSLSREPPVICQALSTSRCCAYLITNSKSGKQYIGIVGRKGKSIRARWKEHCNDADCGKKNYLHRAIRKYGRDAFTIEHIASALTWDDICATERTLIAQFGTLAPAGYNMTGGGQGGYNPAEETRAKLRLTSWKPGVTRSEEVRAKISAATMGRVISPEQIEKTRAKIIGQKRTAETKAAIGAALKGKTRSPEIRQKFSAIRRALGMSPALTAWVTDGQRGRKMSAETRKKMSEAGSRRKATEKTKAKMSLAWERRRAEGKVPGPLTPEQRAKISAAGMGRTPSPETRAKIAAAATGRTASEETKKVLREAWVRRREKASTEALAKEKK